MAIKRLPSTGDAPRSTGVPQSLVPGGPGDSAGVPWAGRTFEHHDTAFGSDDGRAPAGLMAAVQRLRADAAALALASGTASSRLSGSTAALAALAVAHREALAVLSGSRVLVPMLAEAGDLGVTPEGRTVEKTQELSIVTVLGPDGRRTLPVFSSVASLQRWNPEARPIPVPARQAALAAAEDGTDLMIVDPGSPEAELGVRRPALRAVALGSEVLPSWADPEVIAAFERSLAGDRRLRFVRLVPGDPEARLIAAETEVRLGIAPGLDRGALTEVLGVLSRAWGASEVIAERVDSLRVVPVSDGGSAPAGS